MNHQLLVNEIRSLSEVIREQQETILSRQGKISRIETDILMGNLRKLYERWHALQKIAEEAPSPEPVKSSTDELIAHIPVPSAPMPVVTAPTASSSIPSGIHIQPESLVVHVDEPVATPPNEISEETVMPQATLAKNRKETLKSPATLFDEQPTIASEKFQSVPSLYDKISANKVDKSIATKLQKNPVSDLRKSIGINEKFAFINELFDGNQSAYNQAIDQLNGSAGHSEAIAYIENDLIPKYQWTGESDSFLKLRNLIDRRFGA